MPHWLLKNLTDAPSRAANYTASEIDPLEGDRGYVKPFIAGSIQGTGDVLSDMSSPLSLGMSLLGAGTFARLAKLRNLGKMRSSIAPEVYERMGAEFVPQGGEEAFNTIRRARQAAEEAKILDTVRQQISSKKMPISGDVAVNEMMKKISAAKAAQRAKDIAEGF